MDASDSREAPLSRQQAWIVQAVHVRTDLHNVPWIFRPPRQPHIMPVNRQRYVPSWSWRDRQRGMRLRFEV